MRFFTLDNSYRETRQLTNVVASQAAGTICYDFPQGTNGNCLLPDISIPTPSLGYVPSQNLDGRSLFLQARQAFILIPRKY